MLTANFTREYLALGGEVSPTQLPSVASMVYRTGLVELQTKEGNVPTRADGGATPVHKTTAAGVAARQLKRVAWSIPYAVGHFVGTGKPDSNLAKGA